MDEYIDMPDLDSLSPQGAKWISESIPDFDFSGFVNEIVNGKMNLNPDNIFDFLLNTFVGELYSAVRILTVIIGIILVSALLENLRSSFNKTNDFTTKFVTVVLIMGLAVELFSTAGTYAENVAGDLTIMMNSLLPVMMTLTAGCGYVTAGTITNPILLYMCNIFGIMFDKVLIPLTVVYLVISMVDLISDGIKLEKFRELIKKIYNFILGIIMTVFTGLLSLGSFAGVALDSIGAKGAKFALSSMVPFVGRSLADAMSAVASASLVLKNAVGITGIVTILALCIIPIIKIAAVIICIRISAAVCEPVANKKSLQILTTIGDSLSMINASVISITVMMIISVGIVVGIK